MIRFLVPGHLRGPSSVRHRSRGRRSVPTNPLISIDRSSTSVSAIWRQRDRCESRNFQPAGKVRLFLNDCSERLLKTIASIDPFETQQAIEPALSIPEGLP